MKHETEYMTTQEMIIEILIRIFKLAAGRIPLNICKVFTAAFTVGKTKYCPECGRKAVNNVDESDRGKSE